MTAQEIIERFSVPVEWREGWGWHVSMEYGCKYREAQTSTYYTFEKHGTKKHIPQDAKYSVIIWN